MEINIKEDLLVDFSGNAKDKLKERTIAYAEELIREARLLEEGQREDGAKTEITSNIITRAAMVKRTIGIEKKVPRWLKICKIVSVISCAMAGFFFDPNGYTDKLAMLIAFIIFFAIACISTVLMFIKE